jgi:hypothetical protein
MSQITKLARHARQNVVAYLALFIALGGTSAYAANTIATGDIIDNQVTSADVRDDNLGFGGLAAQDLGPGSVRSSEVQDNSLGNGDFLTGSVDGRVATDNSLTGADIDEGSLATVTSSVLGGLGRQGVGSGSCNPESFTLVNCNMVATLNLPAPARVLVTGSARATTESGASTGIGQCELGTTSGPITGTKVDIGVVDTPGGIAGTENLSISGITGVFGAGQHSFGIDCNDAQGIQYRNAVVTAVALSDR